MPTPDPLAWLTASEMAAAWGTSERRVAGYIAKLGITNPLHVRGEGPTRRYSPDAQKLVEREWRSYGRPK